MLHLLLSFPRSLELEVKDFKPFILVEIVHKILAKVLAIRMK
jgi:hypothetical protein